MMPESHSQLLPFLLGAVEEGERLEIERRLLTDEETLVDYLDLKRKMEAAREFPRTPSKQLWQKLSAPLATPAKRRLTFSIGGALAASLLAFWLVSTKPKAQTPALTHSLLFDSSRELPVSSNVL